MSIILVPFNFVSVDVSSVILLSRCKIVLELLTISHNQLPVYMQRQLAECFAGMQLYQRMMHSTRESRLWKVPAGGWYIIGWCLHSYMQRDSCCLSRHCWLIGVVLMLPIVGVSSGIIAMSLLQVHWLTENFYILFFVDFTGLEHISVPLTALKFVRDIVMCNLMSFCS